MPPQQFAIDDQGVNLSTGRTEHRGLLVSIGNGDSQMTLASIQSGIASIAAMSLEGFIKFYRQSPGGGGGIVFARAGIGRTHIFRIGTYNGVSDYNYAIFINQGPYYEEGGGGAWLSCDGDRAQLYSYGTCDMYDIDGSRLRFDFSGVRTYYNCGGSYQDNRVGCNFIYQNSFLWQTYEKADGERITLSREGYRSVFRSSLGFTAYGSDPGTAPNADYFLINAALEYCPPGAGPCAANPMARRSSYVSASNAVIDNGIVQFSGNGIGRVTYPSGRQEGGFPVRQNDGTYVADVIARGATYHYTFTAGLPFVDTPAVPFSGTVTNPDATTASFDVSPEGKVTRYTDEIARQRTYTYSSPGYAGSDPILLNACVPNNVGTQRCTSYTYQHGAVTGVSTNPGDGSAAIGTTAGIAAATCDLTNFRFCNKPAYVVDPRNNRTDFTYHAASGGIETETGPADANGVRPQKRYGYTLLTPRVLNGSGTLVNSTPVWRLTRVSECLHATPADPASCVGSGEERVTTYAYDDPNLFRTSETVAAGNGSAARTTSYAYDYAGDVISVDGPRTDVDDRSYTTYDVLRRPVFEIGADPDGGGALPRPIVRHQYDADGREWRTDYGHGSALDGSDFVVDRFVRTTFDAASGLGSKKETVAP